MQDCNNDLQILICQNWYTIIYASDSDTDHWQPELLSRSLTSIQQTRASSSQIWDAKNIKFFIKSNQKTPPSICN